LLNFVAYLKSVIILKGKLWFVMEARISKLKFPITT
jgi:hypothetical protein